ncbi:hypothetical protein CDD81_6394 [Ophiocordyceps australis]|uniref:Uncharacterized protein n=1 Tax=Ophiocordyceps australis TaxID=1399860 RepID=A0A2C5X9F8_9HYPO|nr:hypothetical protein CDD81_6394 [Ophiocordyceps australis]
MDDQNALLNIHLSDSEDESEPTDRTAQSEEAFQAVKRQYRPRVENGQISKSLPWPLPSPNKQQLQDLLHAVEELYFFRQFDHALTFIDTIWSDVNIHVDADSTRLLQLYQQKCKHKRQSQPTSL